MQLKPALMGAAILALPACMTGSHDHGHGHPHMHGPDGAMLHAHQDKIVVDGAGDEVDNPFHPIRLLLSSEETAGDVTVYEFVLPPRSPGSPPHTHTREDEYFYVVSGVLTIMSGEQIQSLYPGDFAALNRGNTHMFWNASDETTKLIMTTTGGSFEGFMNSVAPRLAEAKPDSAEAAGAVIGQLASEYGITIAMEKMPPEAAPFYGPPPTGDPAR
ncbi:MAG: cupin domain-containing protein [Pseudomonadota bacterium]|nr:cupin domain-containing protein [Pseudomonadota bacterium]